MEQAEESPLAPKNKSVLKEAQCPHASVASVVLGRDAKRKSFS
ncbi:hypothetical protein HMPREF1556_01602 [Porphyromonas sp. oral taxon 278 str. W7784]|nr:hypothetical protein HMPREF1556_01602 [Porphyromonas sp. oral taxon 278 str. W7784]